MVTLLAMVIASAVVAILTSFLFGLVTAWHESRVEVEEAEVPVAAEASEAGRDEARRWPYFSASKP